MSREDVAVELSVNAMTVLQRRYLKRGEDGQVTLIVLWSVYNQQEFKLLTRKKSTYSRPAPTGEETYYEQLSTTSSLFK